jgi:tetratricopeptide (TPR) repeat protein
LFAITTEITNEIAAEIAVELTPEEQSLLAKVRPINAEAYDNYLQARFHFARRTPDGYRKARELDRRAIALDPTLAPAYAGLGHTFGSAAVFGLIEPAEGLPKAGQLAKKALQIDPDLVEAQLLMAGVKFYWDWDWAGAERLLNEALGIDPSSAHAYRILAEVYSVSDRHEQALAAIEMARDLDPLVPNSQFKPALILYLARDFDAAIERATDALQYYPEFWPGHWLRCLSLSAAGRQAQAADACEAAVKYSGREPMALGVLGYVYALGGHENKALDIAGELQSMMSSRYVGRASIAIIHAALGDDDRAFELLEEAFRHRDQMLVHARHAAFLDLFRGDSRFGALLHDPPPARTTVGSDR